MRIEIKGMPTAQQSVKITRGGLKYQPKDKVRAKENVAAQVIQQLPTGFSPITGAIAITELNFIFPPLSSFKKDVKSIISKGGLILKPTKPDLDNLQKHLFDSLNGIVWLDDKQIVEIEKMRKVHGKTPGIVIDFEEVST